MIPGHLAEENWISDNFRSFEQTAREATMLAHEAGFINAFVVENRRERYLGLLRSAAGRTKFVKRLAHFKELDQRFATRVTNDRRDAQSLRDNLVARGAPASCHVISELAAIDGQEIPLESALRAVVGSGMGTIISCVPGQLAYFEGEEPGERYILERRHL
ncbi:MAG: hypothetical protein ACRERX_11440 [Pseudomonas sp.]